LNFDRHALPRTVSGVSDASGTEAAADVPRLVPLRRNKGFRMLWIGQLLSDTGTETMAVAAVLCLILPGLRQPESPAAAPG
jgi:hypothetical protein